ncbi:UNVERIFIED_CONTAM: hypothetical protein GTU68_029210 [Idotea baltica]|nr:hypothetical protein [Idotea baltica]
MSKKDQESLTKIYDYLKQQNRPYSTNDIFLNLHKEFGKTAVQKSLDSLVEKGSIKEKTYGKQKVYVVNQDEFPPLDEAKLREMDFRIKELTEELQLKAKELAEVETKLKTLGASLTTEEAESQIKQIEMEIAGMEDSIQKVSSATVRVSRVEKERIEEDRNRKLKEWRKRKRLATEVLDAILEGYPKSKKELFQDIGIETDQDVGVQLSSFS